jgi:hypothetical protein
MDPMTGKIYDISNDIEQNKIEKSIGRRLIPLTKEQAKKLKPLSNRRRKELLAGMQCPCASGKSFKKCCWKKYK